MLMPSIFNRNFDDWFDFPELPDLRIPDRTEKKLYGKHAGRLMKTDVREHEDRFEVAIDLPGFKKEEIALELNNGYLIVTAEKSQEEKKEEGGKLIRQERYSGSMQRSFYVGEDLTEEDVKAKFEHGVLNLIIPKKETEKEIPEKKLIAIEG